MMIDDIGFSVRSKRHCFLCRCEITVHALSCSERNLAKPAGAMLFVIGLTASAPSQATRGRNAPGMLIFRTEYLSTE